MPTLVDQTATDLLRQLQSSEVSATAVLSAFFERIEANDGKIGSFLSVRKEQAFEQAENIDQRRAAGKPLGLLAGLPVAIKDVFCTRGETTTCGSKMLEHFRPPYDATVVEKIKAADGIILGKTNMDEFAMGGSTENSAFHPTHNPWDIERVPGGSSGGAAAAVAAQMAPLSVGTDTGGSIRQPAAFCGTVGLKPTYGRVSRRGLVAFASSLDQAGPVTRTAEDSALLLEAIAGHDSQDSTSANVAAARYSQTVGQPLQKPRIGIVREHMGEGLDPEIAAAVEESIRVWKELGAEVKEISLPHSEYAIATYYIIAPCEASSNLARYDGVHYGYRTDESKMLAQLAAERKAAEASSSHTEDIDTPLVRMYRQSRSEGFGDEVKRRIMLGAYALSAGYYDAYYLKALKVRRLIRQDFDRAFDEVDLIIGPTTPTPAYRVGEKVDDPLAAYLGDMYTVSANLAGICSLSAPCGFTQSGLPIGLQLQAPAFEEDRLLRAAHMYQLATDWHLRRP